MTDKDLIVNAINNLRDDMKERFDKLDNSHETLVKRVDAVEGDINKVKTVGALLGVLLTFFGWGTLKAWILSMK